MSHLTAMKRKKHSLPSEWLFQHDLLKGDMLDYGCGQGKDAGVFNMEKFDPHWFPQKVRGKFDTITCTYVLNVVDVNAQEQILKEIKALLREGGKAYVSVRRDVKNEGQVGRGCIQRYVLLPYPVVYENSTFAIYELTK